MQIVIFQIERHITYYKKTTSKAKIEVYDEAKSCSFGSGALAHVIRVMCFVFVFVFVFVMRRSHTILDKEHLLRCFANRWRDLYISNFRFSIISQIQQLSNCFQFNPSPKIS